MFEQVAIVGATGAVGRIVLKLLEDRNFPAARYKFLASKRSAGKPLTFKGETHTLEELCPEAFVGCDLVIASTPDDVAAQYLPAAVAAGCRHVPARIDRHEVRLAKVRCQPFGGDERVHASRIGGARCAC